MFLLSIHIHMHLIQRTAYVFRDRKMKKKIGGGAERRWESSFEERRKNIKNKELKDGCCRRGEDRRKGWEETRRQQRTEEREPFVSCWEDLCGAPLMSATHTHTPITPPAEGCDLWTG